MSIRLFASTQFSRALVCRSSGSVIASSARRSIFRQYSDDATSSGGLKEMPSPLRLGNKEEQKEFERLQKEAGRSIALSQAMSMHENDTTEIEAESESRPDVPVHPDYHMFKIKPDFEGERNPKTGEIGGPKQDPQKHGDYSFNGRVTDF